MYFFSSVKFRLRLGKFFGFRFSDPCSELDTGATRSDMLCYLLKFIHCEAQLFLLGPVAFLRFVMQSLNFSKPSRFGSIWSILLFEQLRCLLLKHSPCLSDLSAPESSFFGDLPKRRFLASKLLHLHVVKFICYPASILRLKATGIAHFSPLSSHLQYSVDNPVCLASDMNQLF